MRERKKAATRRALRQAAVSLVRERGLADVTVGEIAARADVSQRTFFNYFTSKEDVVSGMDPALLDAMVEQLRLRPPAEPPAIALRAVLLSVIAPRDSDRQDFLARIRLTWEDPRLLAHHAACWAEAERRLIDAVAERRGTKPATDRYGALVVVAYLAAVRVALMCWCHGDGANTVADELSAQLDLLGHGLIPPGAQREQA